MGVLRRELSDQQVLDYPIIANGNCTARHHELSLRRAAGRGVLPRERFSRVLGMLSSLEVKVLYPT